MTESHTEPKINPLQDAIEKLQWNCRADTWSWLREHDPALIDAIDAVIQAGNASHVDPPTLNPDEIQPVTIPAEALFFDDLDTTSTKLSDVWKGQGYDTDPGARI